MPCTLKFNADFTEAQILFANGTESTYFPIPNGELYKEIDKCLALGKISEDDKLAMQNEVYETIIRPKLETLFDFIAGLISRGGGNVSFEICECKNKGIHGHFKSEGGFIIGLENYGAAFFEKEPALKLAKSIYQSGDITVGTYTQLQIEINNSPLPMKAVEN